MQTMSPEAITTWLKEAGYSFSGRIYRTPNPIRVGSTVRCKGDDVRVLAVGDHRTFIRYKSGYEESVAHRFIEQKFD